MALAKRNELGVGRGRGGSPSFKSIVPMNELIRRSPFPLGRTTKEGTTIPQNRDRFVLLSTANEETREVRGSPTWEGAKRRSGGVFVSKKCTLLRVDGIVFQDTRRKSRTKNPQILFHADVDAELTNTKFEDSKI